MTRLTDAALLASIRTSTALLAAGKVTRASRRALGAMYYTWRINT
jgi:hypothetical protein